MKNFIDYAPTPFYFLNDEFNKEEVLRQLDFMKKNGIRSFFLHVRDGVCNEPWGTDRFFDNAKFIFEQAISRGITPWLYDEDSFPSGQGGGQIVIDRPELIAHTLEVEKLQNDGNGIVKSFLGRVRGLYAYEVIRTDAEEKVRKIKNCFGPVRRIWYRTNLSKAYYNDMADLTYEHVRATTSYTETMFEAEVDKSSEVYIAYLKPVYVDGKYGTRADCLNKETTKEYISRVYEKYKESVGDYFGKEIPGVFMDEPSKGGTYTDTLPEEFLREYGYDISDFYYKLSPHYNGDSKALKRDYNCLIKKLYTRNFIKPIADWCKDNNLKFTGHFSGEEEPLVHALLAEDVYNNVKLLDVPGFDIITTNLGDVKHPGLIFGANLVVSAAVQSGKKTVLAECFGVLPFNIRYDGLKRIADWLFVCGINKLVPHGFHYGYCAFQRADAGKSFFFQDAYFEDYLKLSNYSERVCRLLDSYERDNKFLIVIPDYALMEEAPFRIGNDGISPSERALKIRNNLFALVKRFFTSHNGFDVTQTQDIFNAHIENGEIWIGEKKYSSVFVCYGGEIEENVYHYLKENNVDACFYEGQESKLIPEDKRLFGNVEDLLLYEKYGENDNLLFIFNNSNKFVRFTLKLRGASSVYDAENDAFYKLNVDNGKSEISLQANGSIIILEGKTLKNETEIYQADLKEIEKKCEAPSFSYLPKGAIKAVTEYDVTVWSENKIKFKHVTYKRLRDLIGTQDEIYKHNYVIPYFDTAPRPKSIYPVYAEYEAEINGLGQNNYLLFDEHTFSGNYRIYWNGREVEKEEIKRVRIYDVHNYAFYPIWKKKNRLKLIFEKGGEFDGINGEIYIMKLEDNKI